LGCIDVHEERFFLCLVAKAEEEADECNHEVFFSGLQPTTARRKIICP
jgi:hypothetical protein